MIFGFFSLIDIPDLDELLMRIFSTSDYNTSNKDGHLAIRLSGLAMFAEMQFYEKFFGVGYLNLSVLHLHSSLLTSLLETGLIGFTILSIILALPWFFSFPFLDSNDRSIAMMARYCKTISVCLFVSHLVYEQPYNQVLWIFWGYSLALLREMRGKKLNLVQHV